MKMHIPGFNAEMTLSKTERFFQMPAAAGAYSGRRDVIAQLRLTAGNAMQGLYLEYLCARLGGGMSSNGDGSTSCNF